MGHMGVPWAVGGGAINSEALARMLPYFMFGGLEGILDSTDLRVQALSTPGSSIRVAPGGYNVLGRGTGQDMESYLGKVNTEDVVPISATTSSGSRSDLVIVRVEDPNVPGEPWSDPGDVGVGPYVFTRIIENVPSSTTSVRQLGNNFSAITLARIDIPSSTGTITQGMIKDLRGLLNPVSGPSPVPDPPDPPVEDEPVVEITEKLWTDAKVSCPERELTNNYTGSNSWINFPDFADWIIPVPQWATGCDIFLQFGNLRHDGDLWGSARVQIGNGAAYSDPAEYDINFHNEWFNHGDDATFVLPIAATVALPSSVRGKNTRFRTQFRVNGGDGTSHEGHVQTYRGSQVYLSINFKQYPIY